MEFVITGLCFLLTVVVGILSLAYTDYLNKRKKLADKTVSVEETDKHQTDDAMQANRIATGDKLNANPVMTIFHSAKNATNTKTLMALSLGLGLNVFACIAAFRFDLTMTTHIKLCAALIFLLAALLIDMATKRIPNLLIVIMLAFRIFYFLPEFLLQRSTFNIVLISSAIGLFGCFIVMLIFSLITKGGIGMGDVKLISALGCLAGIAASFYTLVYSMFIGMFYATFLLALKKKRLKDEFAFGPFIYMGYALAIIIGTF